MTKPIGYYIDTTQLEKLCSRFDDVFDMDEDDELIAQYGRSNLEFVRDQEWCDDSLDAYLGKCLDEL